MKLFSLSLLSILPALFGTAAFAQNYSPSVDDLNAIYEPPMNIQGVICSPYTDGNTLSVCKDGVAASRWMAEKYAKAAGAYLGCVDGFSQGLNAGFNGGSQNPTAAMVQDAQTYVASTTFDTAVSRAQAQAALEGQTVSADQIIARYRAVIGKRDANGNPIKPNKDYSLQASAFKGYDDGYNFDVLSKDTSLNAVIQAGWVTTSSSWVDQAEAAKLYALQANPAYSACSIQETIFGRKQMAELTFWDFFRAQGKVNFETYGWNNADWAWDVLINSENTLDTYITFVGIDKQTKQVSSIIDITTTRDKLDANGKVIPVLGTDGKPTFDGTGKPIYQTETVVTGHQTVVNTVPLSDAEKGALKDAYKTGFIQSYKLYYAKQYASINYNTTALDKYKTGLLVGGLLGQEIAQKTATKNAYDNGYKLASSTAYAQTAKDRYKASFDYLIDIFAKNPVLELNSALIIGQTDDGIFRAGEDLKIQFTATNLGEVSRPSIFSIVGGSDVTPAASGFSFSVPTLSTGSFTSGTLGTIVSSKMAENTAYISFGLQNPGDLKEVAQSLIVSKDQNILINDYLEVKTAIPALDYIDGTLTTNIDVINPANSTAPLMVQKVEVNLGSYGVIQSNVLQVRGGGIQNLSISVNSIDPLAIIQAGGVSGKVNTFVGDRLAHSVPITAGLGEDQTSATIRYFDALATQKTTNCGTVALKDRIASLITDFNDSVKADVAKNIVWDDDSAVSGTFVGLIQRFYQEAKVANRITPAAQSVYNQLGQILIQNRDDVKAGGGLRFNREKNRKRFDAQIKKFANI